MVSTLSRAAFGLGCLVIVLLAAWAARSGPAVDPVQPPPTDPPPATTGKPAFTAGPYLQYGTTTGMTIMAETAAPATFTVEYGADYPPANPVKRDKPDTLCEVRLENLKPATKYFYRVRAQLSDGTAIESPILTFLTNPESTDAWSFTVIGDTQRNPKVTEKLAKLMWERRPHFVLHNGDVVDDGAANWQWTGDLFKPCQDLFSRVPVYPCIGNHEKNHAHYYRYFSLPKPEYYYSFRYGNAEFFSLDTNKTATLKPGGEQYEWLDRKLAESTATWKICFHHHPVYSSDSDDYGNTWKGKSVEGDLRVRPLMALYEKHNVDVVFNGHIHLYERSWPVRGGKVDLKRGIVHITSGGGGGKLEEIGPTPTWFKAESKPDYHYCYVTVHEDRFRFKAFDVEGRLFDQFDLTKTK